MCDFIIAICNSYQKGRCKERLNYYVEKDVTKGRVSLLPCPFFENGYCKVNGLAERYARTYYSRPPVYEEKEGELKELKEPVMVLKLE